MVSKNKGTEQSNAQRGRYFITSKESHFTPALLADLKILCAGEPGRIKEKFENKSGWFIFCLAVIVAGSGIYGATIGLWRSPLQALYSALKFPLVILMTTVGTSVLNGMLAQVMGMTISFTRSALAVITSFAVSGAILASLCPVTLFVWFNTPPLAAGGAVYSHNLTLLIHILIIAFAGVAGNVHLFHLLAELGGGKIVAGKILSLWLAANISLGCQLSWIMRPFVGSPGLPTAFFREDAFSGSFYESIFRTIINLLG